MGRRKEKIRQLREYGQSEVTKRETLEAKIRESERNEEVRAGKKMETEQKIE